MFCDLTFPNSEYTVPEASPLLGVAIRSVVFTGRSLSAMRSARSLVGMGLESAVIRYDVIGGPKEAEKRGLRL